MTKTVSATEAKNTLGSLLGQLESKEDAVIIENRGVATAAIISIARFRAIEEFEERERRHPGFGRFSPAESGDRQTRRKTCLRNEDSKTLIDEIRNDVSYRRAPISSDA